MNCPSVVYHHRSPSVALLWEATRVDSAEEFKILEEVAESIEDAIIICDFEGCIRVFNPAAARLFEVNYPTYCSDLYGILRNGEEQPVPPKELPLARALSGHAIEERFEVHQADGWVEQLIASAHPLNGLGAILVCRRVR